MKKLVPIALKRVLSTRLIKSALLPIVTLALGLAFWTATAASPAPNSSPPGEGHQPCTICHTAKANPHEITIDCNALEQHLRNHPEDTAGPCPKTSPTPTPTVSPTPTPGKGHQKCTVCHKPAGPHPQTLTIDCHALQAHLNHGDYEGPCQVTQVTNP